MCTPSYPYMRTVIMTKSVNYIKKIEMWLNADIDSRGLTFTKDKISAQIIMQDRMFYLP